MGIILEVFSSCPISMVGCYFRKRKVSYFFMLAEEWPFSALFEKNSGVGRFSKSMDFYLCNIRSWNSSIRNIRDAGKCSVIFLFFQCKIDLRLAEDFLLDPSSPRIAEGGSKLL